MSVLQRATGLTHLSIGCFGRASVLGLDETLTRMSKLSSLCLEVDNEGQVRNAFHLSDVLRTLTDRTSLEYCGNFEMVADLEACATLPALRSLCFSHILAVTPACLPALQAMSGLTELVFRYTALRVEHFTDDVMARFYSERDVWGWPLKIKCKSKKGH
jgi:hypothetical protein